MAEDSIPRETWLLAYGYGIAAPALVTAIGWPLRQVLGPASILMLYLLGVLLVATRQGRWPATLAACLSVPTFAYFYAPPIFSLAMKDTENVIGLAAMLVVAHVTSGLLERMRHQADLATRRERRAESLYRLSEALAGTHGEDEVARVAVRHLYRELGCRSVLLFPGNGGRLAYPALAPLPNSWRGADLDRAQRIFDGVGAAPSDGRMLPLPDAAGPLGILALSPEGPELAADPEQKAHLDMLVQLLAQSLKRVRLAETARRASVQAETEALRNSLLSAISHDLRTPLTRIMGTASALAEPNASLSPADRSELAGEIREESRHMADLMAKILDMARLTAGTLVLQREWNALEEIVGATLNRLDSLLRDRPVEVRLPENLPLIQVDGVLLQQVLLNLVENAVKYSPAGSPIEIGATWTPRMLRVTVADRGSGVPEAAKERLFEKFYRGAPETAQVGVGLGLALCRAIVEAHQGTIAVESRPGGGALFALTLPVPEPPPLAWEETGEMGR